MIRVPALSSSGWTEDIASRVDKLFSYFLLSEASQSNIYAGHVTSLPAILQENPSSTTLLKTEVEDQFSRYMSRYFDRAEVTVRAEQNLETEGRGIDLRIEAEVEEDGKMYSVGRLISTVESSVMKIFDLNNGEELNVDE